jgi:hypothetical protein
MKHCYIQLRNQAPFFQSLFNTGDFTMRPNLFPENAVLFNNAYTIDVTPALAQTWLESNEFQRPCCQQYVDYFAEQMKSGQWRHHYHYIAFDKNGTLLNGRHRLLAVIKSGQTIEMLVVTNVDCK